ncbi:MAG: OmpH family outer membrane protein, partial [Spirochaetota bacterium]
MMRWIMTVLLLAGCATAETADSSRTTVAYADLEVLYRFVLEHNDEYAEYKDVLIRKYRSGALLDTEKQIKKSVLLEVESAVRYIAREQDVDIVLNKSDALLYGSTESDITQLVLNELKTRLYRN